MTKVEFIIPTYNRPTALMGMLASLVAQTNPYWKAVVVIDNDGLYLDMNIAIVNSFQHPNISYIATEERYNDWGHTPREIGKNAATAEYVIMTGDDNYYTPNFVEELTKVEGSPGIIYWDMVHSHYDYTYFKCTLAYNQIDMGAFATRTDLAKQIKLNTTFAADGEFVEDYKKQFPDEAVVYLPKILFVHN